MRGKVRLKTFTFDSVGDHPRVCGEKTGFVTHIPNKLGSPPRMRGKATDVDNYVRKLRITPAYAGKSRQCNHTAALS